MDKEINKRNYYSIAILICLLLIFSSNPLSLFIKNEDILYYIQLGLKIIFLFVMFIYIKKNDLEKPRFNRLDKYVFMFIPFLLLPFSNIIAELISSSEIKQINVIELIKMIVLSILTAISEEIVFRGTLEMELNKTESKLKAIFISALVFGLVHLLNISSLASIPIVLIQVVYSFYLGMILGLMYISLNNILIPISMHFMFNMINGDLSSMLFDIEYNILYFIINISIGFILLLYYLICLVKFKERVDDNVTRDLDN